MYCHFNNINMYYEVSGSGHPLIMVHGNGEDHSIFDTAIASLAQSFRVYAIDSRCHGKSTHTQEISYDAMADDCIAFVHSLGLEKPFFYGFSDGGIIGLLIAMKEPDLLGKLIISGANLNPLGFCEEARQSIHEIAVQGDMLYQLMDNEPDIDPESLSHITTPTVVLAGEFDLILPEHTRLIADSIPHAQLEIASGEDHGSYITHSNKIASLLLRYLSSSDTTQA